MMPYWATAPMICETVIRARIAQRERSRTITLGADADRVDNILN